MTIKIPLRLVGLFLYTVALLGGAFGIAVVVSDWRDDAVARTTELVTTTGVSSPEARQIAREEAERAVEVTICELGDVINFVVRREVPTQAELQAMDEACRRKVGW